MQNRVLWATHRTRMTNDGRSFALPIAGSKQVILYTLKISTKFGVTPLSFCENQNSVQDQDLDQDHDFTLDFNTRPTFHT